MYQGRTNYETYCVELWLQATEYSYNCCRAQYLACVTDAGGDNAQALEMLGKRLEKKVNAGFPQELRGSVYGDLLQATLENVNWQEVAAAFGDE